MSAERINLLPFRIGFLKQSKLDVAVRRLELQLIRALELHGTIRSELLALLFVLYAAGAWATRGFPILVGHYIVPYDDGSFWALFIGLFFSCILASGRGCRRKRCS